MAWLLGRDDLAPAIDDADYPIYGAAKVKIFADGFGWPFTDTIGDPHLRQMLTRWPRGSGATRTVAFEAARLTPRRDISRRVSRRSAALPGVTSPRPVGQLAPPGSRPVSP
ncbi:hypothetical protein KBX50_27935 [Micromonospora sp. C51]|uniref:hypothetical protein n=1 Tax=Micromonospora sp. C51 TaxID=2824879 RepID=UPI001B372697|nr:hypothetical protein [Micromonospora sp. C51]MBQ1052272.1 hypothetical protein [Micromonospora sp. C51]